MPLASVFVPCRGLDKGLRWNLAALFRQHYPAYELVFVSDREDDAGLSWRGRWRGEFEGETVAGVRFVVAGRATDSGQKVHNLRAAVAEADPASEVFVFVDTDARPRPDWLRSLVAPLGDEVDGRGHGLPLVPARARRLRVAPALGLERVHRVGARPRRAPQLLLGRLDRHPARDVRAARDARALARRGLGRLRADARLAGREALPVRFVPACLTAPPRRLHASASCFEFTTRQLKITRVYAPHLWAFVLVSNLLFVSAFFGGLALAVRARGAGALVRVAARARLGHLSARPVESLLPAARRGARARRASRAAARGRLGAPASVAPDGRRLPLQRAGGGRLAPHQSGAASGTN